MLFTENGNKKKHKDVWVCYLQYFTTNGSRELQQCHTDQYGSLNTVSSNIIVMSGLVLKLEFYTAATAIALCSRDKGCVEYIMFWIQ